MILGTLSSTAFVCGVTMGACCVLEPLQHIYDILHGFNEHENIIICARHNTREQKKISFPENMKFI